jgi:hypothetical protein
MKMTKLDLIDQKLDDLKNELSIVKVHCEYTHKTLEGNGKKGLIQRVDEQDKGLNDLNNKWWYAVGIGTAITFGLTYGLIHFGGLI